MIKKLLLVLSFAALFIKPVFSDVNTFAPMLRIFIHHEIIEYCIGQYINSEYQQSVATEYEKRMDAKDGSVTNDDLNSLCTIGHLDGTECSEFKRALMPFYREACGKDSGKSNTYCIDKIFSGANLRLVEAIGLAKEYAKIKDNREIVCSTSVRKKGVLDSDDYVKCRTADGKHFYEFKFDGTEETNDANIYTSLHKMICKIHNLEYKRSNTRPSEELTLTYWIPEMCDTTDINKCNQVNKSLERFSHNASIGEMEWANGMMTTKYRGCLITFRVSDDSQLRTAYGIDNTVFKDVQYVAGKELEIKIKNYVKPYVEKSGEQLTSFYCANSTREIVDGLITRNDILTCYINGKPIDFLFNDLSESKEYAKNAGLSRIACAQLGGNTDEKMCRGLEESECTDLGLKLQQQGLKGTNYLAEKGGCVLIDAAVERAANLLNEIAVGVVVTVVTGPFGAIPVIVSVIGDLAFEAVQNWLDGIPYKDFKDFIKETDDCMNMSDDDIVGDDSISDVKKYCLGDVLNRYYKLMSTEVDALAPDVEKQLNYKMQEIVDIVGDDSIVYINTSYIPIGKSVRNYSQFALFGFLMIFNPEQWGTKSSRMIKNFTKLQLKASKHFGTYLNDFIKRGEQWYLPPNRLNASEWAELNKYLEPYGVEMIDYVHKGSACKKFFFIRNVTDESTIFSKVYDNMPREILEAKMNWVNNYIEQHGPTSKNVIEALDKVGAFNIERAKQMADDIADEITRRLAVRPDIFDKAREWNKLGSEARKQLVLELQDIITTTRRPHLGNTIINTELRGADAGSHWFDFERHYFDYNLTENFKEVFNTIIHENTHSFQTMYKSSIPKEFLDFARGSYVSPETDYRLYRKTLLEQEAFFVGDRASEQVLKNFGF